MAETIREIRRRTRSIQNIVEITSAMQLVAVSRLQRLEGRVRASRPYADEIAHLVSELAALNLPALPLMQRREVRRIGCLVITSDRGLCGAYNTNIIKAVVAFCGKYPSQMVRLILIGRKGHSYFKRWGYPILSFFPSFSRDIASEQIRVIVEQLSSWYLKEEYDELYLFYTRFVTALQIFPTQVMLLPIVPPQGLLPLEHIFEPSPQEVLSALLPLSLHAQLFRAILEAMTAEQGARMVAMKMATENGEELIDSLTLTYNKARQAAITKDLIEVSNVKNALEAIRERRRGSG